MDRILVSQTPGGLYERYVEEVGKPAGGEEGPLAFEEQPEVGRTMKVAAEYGTEILLPIA